MLRVELLMPMCWKLPMPPPTTLTAPHADAREVPIASCVLFARAERGMNIDQMKLDKQVKGIIDGQCM